MKRLMLVLVLMVLGTSALFFARRKPTATPLSEAERRAEANAIAARLPRLDGYPFEVRYSPSAREQAVRLANLTRDGYMYFATVFPGTSPTLTATFLAPADWPRGYGVPSYYPPDRRLRVATDDNPFWQSFGKIARLTSPFDAYPMLKKTYADSSGTLQIRKFFDLIAVHELAHAFAIQGEADFPTLWLQEIFANLALYAFVARTRPAELPYLTTFPEAETHIALFNIVTRRKINGPTWAARSPNGAWDAFVWNYNVYVRPARLTDTDPAAWRARPRAPVRNGCDAPTMPGPLPPRDSVPLPPGSIALTADGTTSWGYGLYRFGLEVARVELERFTPATGGVRWSPDSKKLLVQRDDLRGVRIYPLYSSSTNQPVDHSYFYAAPGDSVTMRYNFYVVDVAGRSAKKIEGEPIGALGSPDEARWGKGSDELYVVSSTRGLKAVQLVVVDLNTGSSHTIVRDTAATFVDLNSGDWTVANGGEDTFWVSERDGWGHVYRYARDGTLKNQVERGSYKVADILRVDSARKQVYFTAWGKEAGSPHYAYVYRVSFDGSGLTLLSPEPGNHTIRLVPRAPYFIDTYSQIAAPPVTVLRDADGKVVMELARGDATPLRAIGWTPAEEFTVKARDGKTDLWGILHRPSTFDSTRKYPIVSYIYPGPQRGSVGDWVFKGPDWVLGTTVETRTDKFTATRNLGEEGMRRALAELGFIVIQLDALGSSPQRSKAFEDFFYGHVGDNGLPDHVAAIRQLAAKYPWIDTTRVGVVGHSGGGYSAAAAMLHFPDFFKVGVAGSGNHDFRVYGWYWGEKYQGPYRKIGDSDNYEAEANYKYAANLKGKLLLMTGDMDCNNPPAETLRLVDALEKAGKDFDMLIVTDAGHQRSTYAIKRSWDYFVRYLLGAEPPSDYRMIAP